jgi:outer membrane protein W
MEKIISTIGVFCLLLSNSFAQQIDRNHMWSANASFTPSYMFRQNSVQYYLQGTLSYFVNPRISIQGDAAFSIRQNIQQGYVPLKYHSGFLGACYHFTDNGNLDPYIGFQSGFSYLERTWFSMPANPFPVTVSEVIPNASMIVGLNYYVNRYFNIFANLRYVSGQPSKSIQENDGLHEIRFAFGLGFNLAKWQ